MKKVIRLTESDLHNIIKETVNNVLSEGNVEDFIKAITSYGGDDYPQFEQFFTYENQQEFNEWLKEQPKLNGVTIYRGYTFDRQYFEDGGMKEGDIVDINSLTQQDMPSFTPQGLRAAGYINEFGETSLSDTVRAFFVVETKGKYCVDISDLSFYKSEGEVKCTDDARFKVISMKWTGDSRVTIKMEEV